MILSRLSIINFKNIAQADLSFSPNINCFLGNNGMGKTNLLDAIYYLSFCKSYSHIADSQIIRHDEDFFMLQGYYDNNGNEEEVYCNYIVFGYFLFSVGSFEKAAGGVRQPFSRY